MTKFCTSKLGNGKIIFVCAITGWFSVVQMSVGVAIVTVEAETGMLGTSFVIRTDGSTQYITSTNNNTTNCPGTPARVATYTVTFPEPGVYNLYVRTRVGPGNANDDSFFYGNGFGAKTPTNPDDWILVNSINLGGFTNPTDVVTGSGQAGIQVWKWINLSEYTGTAGEQPIKFDVPAENLTQTFQIGGREDGLDIDKFVFGTATINFTVSNLDTGTIPPTQPPVTNVFVGPNGIALHRFSPIINGINADGAYPLSGLSLINGGLCGTTLIGGTNGGGTIFWLSMDGSNFVIIRSLGGTTEAANPWFVPANYGNGFYGTSLTGGTNGTGTVFVVQTNGTVSTLWHFANVHPDTATNVGGASPSGQVAFSGGMLYGTTTAGGAFGNGTVFALSANGTSYSTLHNFSALDPLTGTNVDGATPCAGVIVCGERLYGTTALGGAGGQGVVFSIGTNGANFTVLHSFSALDPNTATNDDGAIPYGGLVLAGDALYGTTFAGGYGGCGTIFSIRTNGDGFAVLHHFSPIDPVNRTNTNGASPTAGLTISGTKLYGVTSAGGTGAAGTVFSVNLADNSFVTIHSFDPVAANGTNAYGAFPVAQVCLAGASLYGTTSGGGPGGAGTVFCIPLPRQRAVITNIVRNVAGGVTLWFVGAPNTTNVVQTTTNLASPISWHDVSTNVAGPDGTWEFTDSIEGRYRFYRSYSR